MEKAYCIMTRSYYWAPNILFHFNRGVTFAQKMTKMIFFCMTKDQMIYLFEHFCSLFVFWFQRLAMPTPRIVCLQY